MDQNGKTLVVAEKPSVARDIARVLKCAQRGEGFLFGGGYVVSWAIGHLATLCDPEDYDAGYKRWRAEHLPILPEEFRCKAVYKTKKQFNVLKKLMNGKDVTMIICATDSGREGELIFRYIYQLANCRKPFKRLWISSLTDSAVKDGFANLKDGSEFDALYISARCRAEADWLVGINATRAYTVRRGELLSVGRVQTPTLAIIVDRQKEINAFVPEDYFEVKASFKLPDGRAYDGLYIDENETRLKDLKTAEEIANDVKGKRGEIIGVESEEKRRPPPQLFDLTELQRECNRVLSFSAKKTLSVAQSLYEKHKLITYPRTDCRYISSDIIPKLENAAKSFLDGPLREAAEYFLSRLGKPISNRIVDDKKITDHHAIIPTGVKKNLSALTSDERAVYDRIARNFLASLHPAHEYKITTALTEVYGRVFISKGSATFNEGWLALYKTDKKDESEPPPLPALFVKETPDVTAAEVLAKKTQPPRQYTEATLLSAMENAGRFVEDEALKEEMKGSGLGTPATRASIIERLIAVGYIERKRKSLTPTEKGIRLIETVPYELRSPETTGKWERGLSRIARGEMSDARFMDSIKKYVAYIVDCAAK